MFTQEQMRDFVRIVADMRRYQREFFRTKSSVALRESRRLEQAVDILIDGFERSDQHWLFPQKEA
jgi:hypothetical protein